MVEKPPKWRGFLKVELLQKALDSKELKKIIKSAQEKYLYWDVFRHYNFPKGINAQEAWAFLKFSQRQQIEETPIKSKENHPFGFMMTKTLFKRLSFIDTHTAGFIRTLAEKPTAVQKDQLIISGLSEEAIASSQIEGASTSRKVAKEMIYSGRKPRTKDEQMIINNYLVMQQLDKLKDFDLSEEILIDIQKKITDGTLDDENDGGRLRKDSDNIVVYDQLTGEIAFDPPKADIMKKELNRLIEYANREDEDGESYVHPVIKATILHFWLAYLHPFVDGNGRTARAIFYWYLIKRDYWLFQYLSVSRAIHSSRKQYDNAFLYSEYDDNDLTYFILYITNAVKKSVTQLTEHYEKKVKEARKYRKITEFFKDLNERQVELISFLNNKPDSVIEVKQHQGKHGVAYETARQDLIGLVKEGLLVEIPKGNKKIYLANINEIRKVLKKS